MSTIAESFLPTLLLLSCASFAISRCTLLNCFVGYLQMNLQIFMNGENILIHNPYCCY